MSKILHNLKLVRIATIYLPIIIGLIFSATGTFNYLEATKGYPTKNLPKYGFIPLVSKEFSPIDNIRVTIRNVSVRENSVDVIVSLEIETKDKPVETFSLQVPYRAEAAYGKIAYMDAEKTNILFDQGEAEVEWDTESDASIISYNFRGSDASNWYNIEFGFRWFDPIIKTGYSSYEILVPFSRVNGIVDNASPSLSSLSQKTPIILTIYLPENTRQTDSIPQPSEVVIDWQDSNVGLSSLAYEEDIDFGSTPGWANLPSFKIAFDIPQAQERYNRLIFDSGLFLGIGLQFLLTGIFDAIKLRDTQ